MRTVRMTGLYPYLAFIWTAVLPVAAAPVHGAANGPLETFLDGLRTLQADFTQQVVNEAGTVLQQASGKVWVSRPGKFRWDYEQPYRQLILTDGDRLWNYDVDLEQATVKEVDAVLSSTPAMILGGDQPIEELFLTTRLGEENGLQWVELRPRSEQASFETIRLGFSGRTLARMKVRDSFGQITRFEFLHVRRNEAIGPGLFSFVPPPGVDVIGAP